MILLAILAMGFVRQTTNDGTPLAWRDRCPLLDIGALDPSGVQVDELRGALVQAIAAWETGSCAPLPFALSEPTSGVTESAFDGHNVIVTRAASYCDDEAHLDEEICLNPGSLAITRLYYVDRPGDPDDGSVIEADMEVNLLHPFATDGRVDAYDLASVLTHEVGHILGLGHTCTTSGTAHLVDPSGRDIPSCTFEEGDPSTSASMYPWAAPGEIRRAPREDEQQAMCLLYRNRPQTCADAELSAGCNAEGSATTMPRLVLLSLFAFVLIRRRGRLSRAR